MSKGLLALSSVLAIVAARAYAIGPDELSRMVQWYGQSSLRIEMGVSLVWLDPVKVPIVEKADLILITHDHADHYSPADIKKLSGPTTIVLVGFDGSSFPRIRPGDRRTFGRPVHRGLAGLQRREDAVPPQVRGVLRLHTLGRRPAPLRRRATRSGSRR